MVGRETPMERAVSATFSPPKTFLTADHFSSGEVKVMVMMLLQEKILSEHHSSGLGKIKSYCKVYCDITIVQKLGSYLRDGKTNAGGEYSRFEEQSEPVPKRSARRLRGRGQRPQQAHRQDRAADGRRGRRS